MFEKKWGACDMVIKLVILIHILSKLHFITKRKRRLGLRKEVGAYGLKQTSFRPVFYIHPNWLMRISLPWKVRFHWVIAGSFQKSEGMSAS